MGLVEYFFSINDHRFDNSFHPGLPVDLKDVSSSVQEGVAAMIITQLLICTTQYEIMTRLGHYYAFMLSAGIFKILEKNSTCHLGYSLQY